MLDLLGAGGFGEVYRARDTRLGRMVALKVLPDIVAQDVKRRERFRREAMAASALNHPNICTVFDLLETDGQTLIVMELVEGKTLQAALAGGPLPVAEAIPIALQVADALGEAHRAGILHRDIKCGNIAVTPRGQVKVLDFGLAKLQPGGPLEMEGPTLEVLTTEGTSPGTPAYMSPEQLLARPLDRRSDLFSFGVVLYQMVTGQLPFRGDSVTAVADAILHAEPRDFGDRPIPASLKAVIRKLLEKDPEKRHASAEELRAELAAVQAELRPGSPPGRSRRALLVAALALTVLVMAVAGWLFLRSSRERWALGTAAPEATRLVQAGDFTKAAALVTQARAVLPKDPTLEKLWKDATAEFTIESSPSGAEVSFRPYRGDESAWQALGRTPVTKVRLPRNFYVWRVGATGHVASFRIAGSPDLTRPLKVTFDLATEKSVPPGMILVTGGEALLWVPRFFGPKAKLDDYLIDRHEVTNQDFKKFVDAGGYERSDFWKQPFVKDGRTLAWKEAMASFRDTTGRPGPATWEAGSFPRGLEGHPVAGVSWFEAAAYAEFAGKSLPTAHHWYFAAQSGAAMLIAPGSNFKGRATQPVGRPGTLSGFGTTDMAGNVKEWCWNECRGGGRRLIAGGGFGEQEYMFLEADAASPWERKPNFGFRCVTLSAPPPPATSVRLGPELRDFTRAKPVPDEVFAVFRRLFEYERRELNARVEETEEAADWTREKVSFDAAYGGERVIAHLFLPRNASPPYQTVVYFPGSAAMQIEQLDTAWLWNNDFIPRSGRALLFPIYKGTFERRFVEVEVDAESRSGRQGRNWTVQLSQDLGRCLDYVESRPDLDRTRLGYYGFSWGTAIAPILLAVEPRFRAAVLNAGGMFQTRFEPELDRVNYLPRVRIPVLMINGRYDAFFPVADSQVPFFRGLGTPEGDKRHAVFDTGHTVPTREGIREALDWLDRYLGPVKR